jgi:hypothetical protein
LNNVLRNLDENLEIIVLQCKDAGEMRLNAGPHRRHIHRRRQRLLVGPRRQGQLHKHHHHQDDGQLSRMDGQMKAKKVGIWYWAAKNAARRRGQTLLGVHNARTGGEKVVGVLHQGLTPTNRRLRGGERGPG